MIRLVTGLIHMYRWLVSPLFPPRCRFEPTCSRYAIYAIETHGLIAGVWLVVKRLVRCHPYEKLTKQLGPTFGYDPVPDLAQKAANQVYLKRIVATKK